MGRLNNTEFLGQLSGCLSDNNGKSSVYLTQKRLSPAMEMEETEQINDLPSNVIETTSLGKKNTTEYPILIRVSMNGKNKQKVKLSTVVELNQLDEFWTEYAQTIKSGFIGLKKKEKKKNKKKVTK